MAFSRAAVEERTMESLAGINLRVKDTLYILWRWLSRSKNTEGEKTRRAAAGVRTLEKSLTGMVEKIWQIVRLRTNSTERRVSIEPQTMIHSPFVSRA
jgi:hypothetical protein